MLAGRYFVSCYGYRSVSGAADVSGFPFLFCGNHLLPAVVIFTPSMNTIMTPDEKASWISRVDEALDDVRPHLAIDGGNIEVVDVTDGHIVEIKWLGACNGCSMTAMTMKAGVEETLKNRLPEINGVVAIN